MHVEDGRLDRRELFDAGHVASFVVARSSKTANRHLGTRSQVTNGPQRATLKADGKACGAPDVSSTAQLDSTRLGNSIATFMEDGIPVTSRVSEGVKVT